MKRRLDELKGYVSLTDEDAKVLAAFGSVAESEFPRIARQFCDRMSKNEDACAVLRGKGQRERLSAALVRWMQRLCSGRYDQKYFEGTAKVERVHIRVDLPQRCMFTAMAFVRLSLLRVADERMGDRAVVAREALTRLLDLELTIMVEAYREDFITRLEGIERTKRERRTGEHERIGRSYVQAMEVAKFIFLGLDARGEIRLFNAEAERMLGVTRDEAMGKPFAETFLQEDLIESQRPLFRAGKAAAASGDVLRTCLRTRAGRYRAVRLQLARTAPDADGVVMVLIGTDTTEEDVATEVSHQAEKLASVGTLASGFAHEIRNPLNGARLHVDFMERALRNKGVSEDVMDALRVVSGEIHRLARLVSEFLDFARPEPAQRKALSVLDLCERALRSTSPAQKGITVSIDPPSSDIELVADGSQLERVIVSLLQNACEALKPRGHGHVILRARRHPRQVVVEVEDDGPGITHGKTLIFDPFFSTKPSGTGLGLPIAHRIVTGHRGTLVVDSQPGKTVFRMSLPLGAA